MGSVHREAAVITKKKRLFFWTDEREMCFLTWHPTTNKTSIETHIDLYLFIFFNIERSILLPVLYVVRSFFVIWNYMWWRKGMMNLCFVCVEADDVRFVSRWPHIVMMSMLSRARTTIVEYVGLVTNFPSQSLFFKR